MRTPVVRGPKDCTTRTGPQAEATSIVGSRSHPCPGSVPRHTSAPILGSTLHWRIVDAARGDLKEGHAEPTPGVPSDDLIPSLLTTSDVLGTGWFAADAANVKAGSTVVVVGDGAVGLLGVLSAKQMGAERIIAMSRHEKRQKLAREFGATDIVPERSDEGVKRR